MRKILSYALFIASQAFLSIYSAQAQNVSYAWHSPDTQQLQATCQVHSISAEQQICQRGTRYASQAAEYLFGLLQGDGEQSEIEIANLISWCGRQVSSRCLTSYAITRAEMIASQGCTLMSNGITISRQGINPQRAYQICMQGVRLVIDLNLVHNR